MNQKAQLFLDIGEPFAAGFLEMENAAPERIFCRAYRRYYETCRMFYQPGEILFPVGCTQDLELAVRPQYVYQYEVDWEKLRNKSPEAADIFRSFANEYTYVSGWSHGTLQYRRILNEGVNEYERRVQALPPSDFREGLLDVLAGIRCYHERALAYLQQANAPEELIQALHCVPFEPASTAYEAMVCLNFMLSLDGWDNMSRVDSMLASLHKGEDLRPCLRRMMQNIQANGMWSLTVGPEYNDITYQVLEASRGLAKPSIQLRVVKDMPDDLWKLALERVMEGGCQPAFLNDRVLQERFRRRFPNANPADLFDFVCGGCTETHFAGLAFSGATDGTLNMLKAFEDTMQNDLSSCASFADFYQAFLRRLDAAQDALMAEINHAYNERAKRCFAPIRSLFTDDCIDNQKGLFQGGARFTFSCPADAGIPNTIDSLLAVKHLVYDTGRFCAEAFVKAVEERSPLFLAMLKECPCYGVGNDEADQLAHELTTRFYARYREARMDFGDGYLPTAHQFTRHVDEGRRVGPTPDGRKPYDALADSVAAVNGKAEKGPTMMLLSASRYNQSEAYSVAVTNLSVSANYKPEIIRALIEGYFAMDGTQLQITAANPEVLKAARANPDDYRDLIVRVGGFSEYFCNLSTDLQDAVIARTLFQA